MPIFRSGKGAAPAWCEMESFELLDLRQDERRTLQREGRNEHFIVCRGSADFDPGGIQGVRCSLGVGGKLELVGPAVKSVTLVGGWGGAQVFRAVGRWGSITSSGIFAVRKAKPPANDTPYSYVKTTGFDNHYHDCDEYWVVLEGKWQVASEGKMYEVGPGDCVATGMGWHHDVVSIEGDGPYRGIWFEGTLEGRKRVGHLWEPQHGKAVAMKDRV